MKELERRVAALEERMQPVDYVELLFYFSRQIECKEGGLGFPIPPPGLESRVPPGFELSVFPFGRNEEDWNANMEARNRLWVSHGFDIQRMLQPVQ